MITHGSQIITDLRRGTWEITRMTMGTFLIYGSPYSREATAALKEHYPDLWTTLRQFGFDNPSKVPFINQYPLVAPYLLADGLAFMVDCQYECSTALWKDLMQGIEFTGNGKVQIQDGVPYFDGTAWYKYSQNLVYPHSSSTIEVVVQFNGYTNSWGCVYFQGNTSGIVLAIGQGTTAVYRIDTQVGIGDVTTGVLQTIALSSSAKYKNGVIDTTSPASYITLQAAADTRIGCRSNDNSCLIGKIYAIRIYNRLLTEQEILANQAIDLQRWQPS